MKTVVPKKFFIQVQFMVWLTDNPQVDLPVFTKPGYRSPASDSMSATQ
ncbi:15908_t:CDS:1, partial [Racocetra fulgida]